MHETPGKRNFSAINTRKFTILCLNLCVHDGFNLKYLFEYKKRCTKHRENAKLVFRFVCVWWVYLKDLFHVPKHRENANVVFKFVCAWWIYLKDLFHVAKSRENANVVFRFVCAWWVYLKDLFYVAKPRENVRLVFRFVCVRGFTSKMYFTS